jgi:hypothetical protein
MRVEDGNVVIWDKGYCLLHAITFAIRLDIEMMEGSKPLEVEKAMEDAQVAITPPKEDYNNIHKCTIVEKNEKLYNIFGHN